MKTSILNKTAKMQGIIGLIILVISIVTLALYTGSQPGKKPLLKFQTKESMQTFESAKSLGDLTGRAVTGMGGDGWIERGCFLSDTQITMADGSVKPISEINLGEQISSFDESAIKAANQEVSEITAGKVQEYLLINGNIKVGLCDNILIKRKS